MCCISPPPEAARLFKSIVEQQIRSPLKEPLDPEPEPQLTYLPNVHLLRILSDTSSSPRLRNLPPTHRSISSFASTSPPLLFLHPLRPQFRTFPWFLRRLHFRPLVSPPPSPVQKFFSLRLISRLLFRLLHPPRLSRRDRHEREK